jgi:Uma2 family endonuclease
MATTAKLYTADDLWHLPGDEPWELWDGELRKVPGSGIEASDIAGWILSLLNFFVRPRHLGVVTGADGTYVLSRDPDTVVSPDVAFVRQERFPNGTRPRGYSPVAPDLAVEVVSPTDRPGDITRKQDLYRRAGVPLVWWVYPERRIVAVYRDGSLAGEFGEGAELDGGEVIPGFRLGVSEIFATG